MLTPYLRLTGENATLGIFLGRGGDMARLVHPRCCQRCTRSNTTLDAPLGHINVHIRDKSTLLLYQQLAYAIYETREDPYCLLILLGVAGTAFAANGILTGQRFMDGTTPLLLTELTLPDFTIGLRDDTTIS
ncbi:hypothetical protein PAXINDRAFT_21441 [Paxillus involutus ATCC 200175]|uniref:Uncharacterized protein n=1 Tax=Paxillus involutus ATCC 200175 TaxID=664439 RepID=A0A0C9TAQ7_PAXIN|nr:hypothetical protein PAXINDRAFT_21441 [Paxillus involutus ATCC 200175]